MSDSVNARVFSEHYQYAGSVVTRGHRLADMLNNPTTEVLEMHRVSVLRPGATTGTAVDCTELLVKKDQIVLAIPEQTYEAPGRRLYSYVEKQRYLAQVVLPGHTLVGTIHLPSRGNPWLWLSEKSTEPTFVPITDVTVTFSTVNVQPLHTKVVIFRRHFIESLFLSDRPVDNAAALVEKAQALGDRAAAELASKLPSDRPAENDASAASPVSIPFSLPTDPRRA